MRPRALVFDLDGTMVDNMALHAEAFAEFNARHGLAPFTLQRRAELDGKRNRDIFPVLFGRELGEDELRRLSAEKEGLYRELSRGRLQLMPGLARLLALAAERQVAVAIATSAPEENVRHTLTELDLLPLLPRVSRSDQVPRGKPFPDVFLAAARLVDVPPGECLAFEDAPVGVSAAMAAGMRCIAVATSFDRAAFLAHGTAPDGVIRDYDELLAQRPLG
jgi:beta-phosphoglucomutase